MEATSLVKSAGQQLGKWLVQEFRYLHNVKEKVEGLQSELEWIQCFLKSADDMRKDDEIIRKWISEINDFSYEAEDILEKYLLKVSHPRESGFWNLLKWTICVAGDAKPTHEVGSEIDKLTSKISKLTSRMITYKIKPTSYEKGLSSSSSSLSRKAQLRRTHSHLPVDDIIGLKEDSTKLLNELMKKDTKVIAIVDKAGSGKTTLARKVYHAVKGRQFEMCAWIYVSQKFQSRDVIQEILLRLYTNDKKKREEIQNAEQLERMLSDVLKQKKCLVVLDDLWKRTDWDSLEAAFPISDSRSKLLITTRNTELLSHVDPKGSLHKLCGLNPKESLELFNKKAFLGKDTTDPNTEQLVKDMKKLGEEMVKQCKGLPLAIVVLGGLLASKKTLDEWQAVKTNISNILNGEEDKTIGITDVLELSYTDLPYHLKPCFLHMGNFPEDCEIPTKKLYRMWIAEGIIASDNSANLKNIANSYLRQLVQRCIVEVGKKGEGEKIKSCRLHDLMWNMCTLKANEVNFLCVLRQDGTNEGYTNSSAIRVEKLHRLALHINQSLQSAIPCQINKASHLRSLVLFNNGPVHDDAPDGLEVMINNLKLLRILDLENNSLKEVPKELGTLIHLRYLSIKGTKIKNLPSSIGNLRCLQTLDLRVSLPDKGVMKIPNVLWRMERLKHLYLPSHAYQVNGCRKLRIAGLSSLEILKNFDTRRSQVTDLRKLENLRKLCIKDEVSKTKTVQIIMECQSIKNEKLVHLSLKVHGAILEEDKTVLLSCNTCLHTLEMVGINSDIPELRLNNVKFPDSLTILVIKNCKLMCGIQAFRHLRQLKSLSLDRVSFSEDNMDCSNGGFMELVDLKLSNIDNLEWKVGGGAMRKLYRLQIYNCQDLEIPAELPTSMHVVCHPCVTENDRYVSCPFREIVLVDDEDNDLATQYSNNQLSAIKGP